MPFYGAGGLQNPYALMQDPLQTLTLGGMMQSDPSAYGIYMSQQGNRETGGQPTLTGSVNPVGGGGPSQTIGGGGSGASFFPRQPQFSPRPVRYPPGYGPNGQSIYQVDENGFGLSSMDKYVGPAGPGGRFLSPPGWGQGGNWSNMVSSGPAAPGTVPGLGMAGMFQNPAYLQQLIGLISGQGGVARGDNNMVPRPAWADQGGYSYWSGAPVPYGNDMIARPSGGNREEVIGGGGNRALPGPGGVQSQPPQSQPKGNDDWWGRWRGPYKGRSFDDVVYLNSLRGWDMGKDYTPDPSLVQKYGSAPTAYGDRRVPTGPGQGGGGNRRALPPDGGVRAPQPPVSGRPAQPPTPATPNQPRGYRGGGRRQLIG